MRSMVVVAFGILGVAQAAAADLPAVLRGPIVGELVPAYRWSGVYGGAQAGFSTASVNFNQNVGALVGDMLRLTTIEQDFNISSWPVLGKPNPVGGSYGGFVGYNWQWEDAVTGFEINYNRTSLSGSASNSLSRSFVDSNPSIPTGHHYFYNPATVTGTAAARITDWGTFRFRGGWAAGMFLPYGFVAFAVGRADISRSASVTWTVTDLPDTGIGAWSGCRALAQCVFARRVGIRAIRSASGRPHPYQYGSHGARIEILIGTRDDRRASSRC